jgi:hypothetical protein
MLAVHRDEAFNLALEIVLIEVRRPPIGMSALGLRKGDSDIRDF